MNSALSSREQDSFGSKPEIDALKLPETNYSHVVADLALNSPERKVVGLLQVAPEAAFSSVLRMIGAEDGIVRDWQPELRLLSVEIRAAALPVLAGHKNISYVQFDRYPSSDPSIRSDTTSFRSDSGR